MRRLWAASLLLLLTEYAQAATALQAAYYQDLLLQRTHDLFFVSLPQWALGVNLVAAAILYFVWRNQRNVPQLNWLLGACLTGNITNLTALNPTLINSLVVDILLSAWLYCLARILISQPSEPRQRWLSTAAALLLLGFGLARALGGDWAHGALLSVAFGLLAAAAVTSLHLHIRSQRSPRVSLLVGVFLLGLSGMLDNLAGLLNWPLAQQLLLMPFTQMFAVVLVVYFLVTRHANTQLQLSILNATLDTRVREAERELEDRYRLLTQDAVDTAALRERRDIYHSIHEDLSDKLLQLIYHAPAPETADLARAALAELRDSQRLQPAAQRAIPHILADALVEVQTRCDQAKLQLSWQVAPQLDSCTLNARQESALTRTLREAISNLFKHAHANKVDISFYLDDSLPLVMHYCVSDDGVGIDSTRPRGRGLVNMRQRIEELGGKMSIDSSVTGGTSLCFSLPLTAAASQ